LVLAAVPSQENDEQDKPNGQNQHENLVGGHCSISFVYSKMSFGGDWAGAFRESASEGILPSVPTAACAWNPLRQSAGMFAAIEGNAGAQAGGARLDGSRWASIAVGKETVMCRR
jgi:hypothetical protein